MAGSWISLSFLTGTCGQYEVMRVAGTFKCHKHSVPFYRALMNGRKLSLISLDVDFIDDMFYIGVVPYNASPVMDQDCQHIWNEDGYTGLLIDNW
ncbi:hypothetical protein AMTRI_Chr07g27580 [Amborella trichopoda]